MWMVVFQLFTWFWYIYIYIHIYIYTHTHTHMHMCVCVCGRLTFSEVRPSQKKTYKSTYVIGWKHEFVRVCIHICVCVCVCVRVCAGTVLEPVSIMVCLFKLSFQCEIRELRNTCSEVQESVTECFLLVSCWAVNIKSRFYFTVNLPLLSNVCFCNLYSLFWLLDPNGPICRIHSIN
jgi:hypothetical protein